MAKKQPKSTRTAATTAACGDSNDADITFARGLAVLFAEDLHPTSGASRHTIDSYKTTFRLFLRFLKERRPELLKSNVPVERVESSVVEAFLRHLGEERGCIASSINVRRAAFAALARALTRRYPHLAGYCQSLAAIRSRKAREALVGYFEVHELDAIFAAVDTAKPDGFRDLVILRCLYNTGARASELCGLRLPDLRLEDPAHVVLHGKGGKVRTVPLWPVTADLLRAYLAAARRAPKAGHQDFVFIGRRGNVLTRQGLYKIARHYLNMAANKLPQLARRELHPVCSYRHTTATHLLMAGVSMPEIQDLLGHARPETTMRYRAVSLERKRHALSRLLAIRSQKPGAAHTSAHVFPGWTNSEEAIAWLERL